MFFVYHGSLDNSKSIGTNALIKEFAKIATCPEDIVSNYSFLHKNENITENNTYIKENILPEYKDIYKVITEEPIDINDIAKCSNIKLKELMPKLTILELEGKIIKVHGNRYKRTE
jgi:predicted Rossmann fold nucleotide-binding protein DprA/Smf involved in DNA uptake